MSHGTYETLVRTSPFVGAGAGLSGNRLSHLRNPLRMDTVTPAVRSRMMGSIRAKETSPEILVRKALFSAGFRFRLHRRDLPGSPDIVLPRHRMAIFVHGCFWHAHEHCRYFRLPASNTQFWNGKLQANVLRDKRNREALMRDGWRVFVVWECSTRQRQALEHLRGDLVSKINSDEVLVEILPRATVIS